MPKDHDKVATRLAQIIMKLNDGARLSVAELAEEFNVSIKTIQRDFKRLAILPIQKEKDKYFLADYALGKLSFKDIKNFAILSGIMSLFPKLDESFIADLLNAKLNQAYLIKNQGFAAVSSDIFNEISAAIVRNWLITCRYNDKLRELKPYKLINNNAVWYLLADDNGKLKNFTLEKIKELKLTEKSFIPNPDFNAQILQNNTNWFSQDSFEVVLEIKSEALEYFKRKEILPNYKIIDESKTAITISTIVAYDDEALRVVKYWLPFINIISPQSLKVKFDELLREYLRG
ncbi:helix-turn-helix transcriptional regulator [Campylobacter sputorum]|uniref:helix-turn-helix transcriptional regulator n=1 Tax=Campylobacter sputorum TaxID=206 RepID=UPI000B7838A1|nr:WYL domain-containing protein [Campylobacter sputorum]ASM37009.1 transcriptional regulator (WYL domain) [Campylobacter sputorum bv. faecalis CCUG 20703]